MRKKTWLILFAALSLLALLLAFVGIESQPNFAARAFDTITSRGFETLEELGRDEALQSRGIVVFVHSQGRVLNDAGIRDASKLAAELDSALAPCTRSFTQEDGFEITEWDCSHNSEWLHIVIIKHPSGLCEVTMRKSKDPSFIEKLRSLLPWTVTSF